MDKTRFELMDEIHDCYMRGIGDHSDISDPGYIEAIGKDWVIVRNKERGNPIFVDKSSQELFKFLQYH